MRSYNCFKYIDNLRKTTIEEIESLTMPSVAEEMEPSSPTYKYHNVNEFKTKYPNKQAMSVFTKK